MTHIALGSDESASEIRDALKSAAHFENLSLDERIPSEYRHGDAVPFAGTVYPSAGCSLSTKEINRRYIAALPSTITLTIQLVRYGLSRSVGHLLHKED